MGKARTRVYRDATTARAREATIKRRVRLFTEAYRYVNWDPGDLRLAVIAQRRQGNHWIAAVYAVALGAAIEGSDWAKRRREAARWA